MNMKIFQEVGNMLEKSMDIGDRDLNILLSTFPDLMLWVLFLGGSAAVLPRKVWFAKMVTRILMVCETEDNMIKDAANAFLWPEGRENYNGCTSHDLVSADVPGPELWVPGVPILYISPS
jgi:hypothetical protein